MVVPLQVAALDYFTTPAGLSSRRSRGGRWVALAMAPTQSRDAVRRRAAQDRWIARHDYPDGWKLACVALGLGYLSVVANERGEMRVRGQVAECWRQVEVEVRDMERDQATRRQLLNVECKRFFGHEVHGD